MANQFLSIPYSFATGGNYAAGALPWSGLPRVVVPSAAALTAGFTPDQALPAETVNWLEQIKANALAVQAHDAMLFSRTDLGVGSSSLTLLSAVQQTIAIGAPADRQKSILVSGATAGGLCIAALLNDGTAPPTGYGSLAGDRPTSAPASDANGVFFVGITGGGVIKSADGGATPSTVTVTGLTAQVGWVGCTSAHYLVFEPSTQKLFRATSLGGAWSNTVMPFTKIQDMMTDGAGTWVLITTLAGQPQAYYSTDDGVSWSFASALGASGSSSGSYSAAMGLFFVATTEGKLWGSTNGLSWSLYRSIAAFTGTGLGFVQNFVATCGPAIAVVVNRVANSLGKYPYGIAYTLDQGMTWAEAYIGNGFATNPITSLISANGRFYAIDGVSLYQSALLETPAALYTGI